jgi:type IV pilus assembly protein PilN
MWLTSLNQTAENNMEMKGLTFDFSEVAEYMVKLEKQASVEKVTLVTISTTKVEGEEAYDFLIKVVLKKDLGSEG